MKNELYHNKGCDCFECQDNYIQELQARYMKPNFVDATGRSNHAESVSKPAEFYLDSTLVAKVPLKIYKTPDVNSDVIIDIPKGGNVGKIAAYVVRNGQVWWDIFWFSGKHAGWVKHDPGLFNTSIAEQTASGVKQAEIVAKSNAILTEKSTIEKVSDGVTNVIEGSADALGSFGSNIKWILIATVILVIIYFGLKAFK